MKFDVEAKLWNLPKFIWAHARLKLTKSGKSYKQKKFNKTKLEFFHFAPKVPIEKFFLFFFTASFGFEEIVNIWVLFLLNRRERISKVYIKLD